MEKFNSHLRLLESQWKQDSYEEKWKLDKIKCMVVSFSFIFLVLLWAKVEFQPVMMLKEVLEVKFLIKTSTFWMKKMGKGAP